MQVYLDNSATTKPSVEVINIFDDIAQKSYGNPSSLHRLGLESEKILTQSRKDILSALGLGSDYNLVFTSGGTEADNLAVIGYCLRNSKKKKKIMTSTFEHPAVLESFHFLEKQGFIVEYIPVDNTGFVDLEFIKGSIDENTLMISVMRANNEVGTLQPIGEIREICANYGTIFHTDAVQSFCKVTDNRADLISISGHKIRGPKGIGALAYKKNMLFDPILKGGGQELGIRSGTENLPAIGAFAFASKTENPDKFDERVRPITNRLKQGISDGLKDIVINGSFDENCLANLCNISFLGTRSEVILHFLEDAGIYVSSGSACSSKNTKGSHVLKAMGKNKEEVESAVRFSLGVENTECEIDYVIDKTVEVVKKFRKLGKFR